MVREEEPFVPTSPAVLEAMERQAAALGRLPIDLVAGVLDAVSAIDESAMRRLLAAAPRAHLTFHRAFEDARDPEEAVQQLLRLDRVDRVLTSAGPGPWDGRVERVRGWARALQPRITLLFAVGLERDGLSALATFPERIEIHVGRAARCPPETDAPVAAAEVRRIRAALDGGR
jgi:copper homeostasis protein